MMHGQTKIKYISVNTSILRNLGLHTVYSSATNTGHHSHTKDKEKSSVYIHKYIYTKLHISNAMYTLRNSDPTRFYINLIFITTGL